MTVFPDEILVQHAAILGKTGAGKTSTAKLLVETVVARDSRVCILDPVKSDWWGLTSSADGKAPGLPFRILGGPHGHVPLHSGAGQAIGKLVATGALPLSIVDMADFEPGGLQRFFCDFASALLRHIRGVLYLVIEEAHEFAPKERSGIGKETTAIHYAKKLATAGRSKGIRLVVATQRTQALHNAVLGSCETMIAHRFITPADQKPVIDWLKAHTGKEIVARVSSDLAALPTGTGWLCSGEAQIFERVDFPRISTYDNSATPTDDSVDHDVVVAAVDPAELRDIIGEAVAEAEANDPKALRDRIKQLEAERGQVMTDPEMLGRARQEGFEQGFRRGHEAQMARIGRAVSFANDIGVLLDHLGRTLETPTATIDAKLAYRRERKAAVIADGGQLRENPVITETAETRAAQDSVRAIPGVSGQNPDPGMTTAARRILSLLAQHSPARFSWPQIATLAGLKARGGHFNHSRKQLRTHAYIEEGDGLVWASDAGLEAAGVQPPAPRTVDEKVEMWKAALPTLSGQILDILIAEMPNWRSKEFVAGVLDKQPRGGHWNNALSNLRNNGLIEQRGQDIRASADLFTVPQG